MTPEDAIKHIERSFPNLRLKRSKGQSSFSLPDKGNAGRVMRIEHAGAKPLKRAASSLRARHVGLEDGPHFLEALPPTLAELEELVNEELLIAEGQKEVPKNWELALQALIELGGKATREQITHQVVTAHPNFRDPDNVRKDLVMLSVNDPKRRAYRRNNTLRRGGRPETFLDRVYRGPDEGKDTIYELYDPIVHGVWIGRIEGKTWQLERQDATVGELIAQSNVEFDPSSPVDGKAKVARQIAARQGQQKFREGLLAAYGGQCCVSGCAISDLLEAAHITPYNGTATNVLDNGLLLRADLHTLFDLGLMRIDSETMRIEVHPTVLRDADYAKFQGLVAAKAVGHTPSKKAIQAHRDSCAPQWIEVATTPL